MSIVIVHGPKASGKTTNAERLRKHFKCKRIVDGWDGYSHSTRPRLKDGDLALTCDEPPFSVPGAKVVDIETAKLAIGR